MKDVIVIIAVTAVMIGGFFIMKRLDAFLEANEEATKKEYKNTPDVQFLDTDDYEKVISDIEKFKTTHEDIHEAIVDQATWDIVRQVRQGKRRRNSMGEVNKYSGLLYCSDCGSKLYFVRGRTMKPDAFNFICSRYRKHMGEKQCTPHSIREIALDEIILEEIRRVTSEARKHTAEFVRFISQKSSSENRKELNAKLSEQGKLTKRNEELNLLFKRLYEDNNVLGKVTNEQFRMLSDGYNAEQKTTVERLENSKSKLNSLNPQQSMWKGLCHSHASIRIYGS